MKTLFRGLQPPQKFRISVSFIAQLLKIPKHLIVRVECWAYVIFVHRLDKGGQLISYRKLQQWRNSTASQIQYCGTGQEMCKLWQIIEQDENKHQNQYDNKLILFLRQIWDKRWESLPLMAESFDLP